MGKVRMPRRKSSTNSNFFNQTMDYDGVEVADNGENSDKEQKTSRPVGRRRGRGPSKNPCLNRNALMARENRQRKKEYVQRIENKLSHLQTENRDLKLAVQRQSQENMKLKIEVNHLRAVMRNSTTVERLLKAINDSLDNSNGSRSNSLALTERLNTHDDNTRAAFKATGFERISSAMSYNQSCAASSTSNEENSDPLYEQGEQLITKLASLVEQPDTSEIDIDDNEPGPVKKSRYSPDTPTIWVKDDLLDSQVCTDPDLTDWTDKKMTPLMPLSTDKSEFLTDDFNVDSLFENFNESTTDSLGHSQVGSTFAEDSCNVADANLLPTAGICIHVNQNKVSLEFCAECHTRVNTLGGSRNEDQ